MDQKILTFDVALKSTERQRVQKIPEVYTNDLGSVSLQFRITDCTDTELTGSTAIVLLKMRDGSFFQGQSVDVERTLNVFSYTLKENEGNHDGLAEIQLIVAIDAKEFATQKYNFKVISGLDSDVAREIMIYDWSTLTAEARAYIDQFTADEVLRDAEFDNAQFDRNAAFNAAQTQRVVTFNSSEAARVSLFNSKETARAAGYDADHAQALLDQSNYAGLLEDGVLTTQITAKLNELESTYTPDLLSVKQQLAEALKGKEGTNLKVIAGTVQNDGTGWKFIVDASHQADLNCDSVSADNANVHINYASIDATKVVSFMVSPDESFAALGYFCGASVGVEQSSIKLYKSVPKSVGCVATCTSSGFTVNPDNIGITSLAWDKFKFKLRINHADLGSAYSTGGAPVILPYVTGKFIPRTVGINPRYTDIEFYNFDGTRIQALSDILSFSFTRTTPEENTTKLIDPTTIVNASASLWFVGIFEVV